MKLILMAFILVSVSQARADSGSLGLGVILGSPTGISANYLLSDSNSVAMALAFDDDDVHAHIDYLWRFPKSLNAESVNFGWYSGFGLKLRDHDHDDHLNNGNHHDHHDDGEFGPRAVAGINHEFERAPIEVFAEASLILYVIDETDVDFDFGLGGRYYF